MRILINILKGFGGFLCLSMVNAHAISPDQANKFSTLALDCIHKEYPNKISHTMASDRDVMPPRKLHPAFYGCFDWHSSVHGHWLLVRLLHMGPQNGEFRDRAIKALDQNFTAEKIAGEMAYFAARPNSSYERPYGLAWLLQLTAELRQWDDPKAREWLEILRPLESQIVLRLKDWLPKLSYAIRLGTHNQTAFAFGLMLDWARISGDGEFEKLLVNRVRDFHLNDVNCPLAYEPSGEDFLSPCLMEADLMRRILTQEDFSPWLENFLPQIPRDGRSDWLSPGMVKDVTDGKLVHLDGVNLSRAWNLENLAAALPKDDKRRAALLAAAEKHKQHGLASVSGEHYSGGHWLASFATYLMTKRGY